MSVMPNDDARMLMLAFRIDSPAERTALEQALLRARADDMTTEGS